MVQGPENQSLDLNQSTTKIAIPQMANVRPTGRSVTEPNSKEEQLINETVQLLTEGETRISLDTVYKFFFLVVGITGAGKSTITNCLTNIKNLYSYEARDRFIIKDRDEKISGEEASIVSKTIFPELLVDEFNKVAFYDLPGFCDTRTAAIEIANAWFMRKVACHAEKIKLLFVVNYSSMLTHLLKSFRAYKKTIIKSHFRDSGIRVHTSAPQTHTRTNNLEMLIYLGFTYIIWHMLDTFNNTRCSTTEYVQQILKSYPIGMYRGKDDN